MTNEIIKHTSDLTYEEDVKTKKGFVLVDFWAEWCGPCKRITQVLDAVAPKFEGKVEFYKLNVDESPKIPAENSIRSIPTLILLKDGSPVGTKIGALSQDQLQKFLESHLADA